MILLSFIQAKKPCPMPGLLAYKSGQFGFKSTLAGMPFSRSILLPLTFCCSQRADSTMGSNLWSRKINRLRESQQCVQGKPLPHACQQNPCSDVLTDSALGLSYYVKYDATRGPPSSSFANFLSNASFVKSRRTSMYVFYLELGWTIKSVVDIILDQLTVSIVCHHGVAGGCGGVSRGFVRGYQFGHTSCKARHYHAEGYASGKEIEG
jgi:hypothetical protein